MLKRLNEWKNPFVNNKKSKANLWVEEDIYSKARVDALHDFEKWTKQLFNEIEEAYLVQRDDAEALMIIHFESEWKPFKDWVFKKMK